MLSFWLATLQNDMVDPIKMSFIIEVPVLPYLLGLLAMIKCSICSYQCDN